MKTAEGDANMDLVEKILQIAKERKVSHRKLARACGMSDQAIDVVKGGTNHVKRKSGLPCEP